jgi:hypothetical protein
MKFFLCRFWIQNLFIIYFIFFVFVKSKKDGEEREMGERPSGERLRTETTFETHVDRGDPQPVGSTARMALCGRP